MLINADNQQITVRRFSNISWLEKVIEYVQRVNAWIRQNPPKCLAIGRCLSVQYGLALKGTIPLIGSIQLQSLSIDAHYITA